MSNYRDDLRNKISITQKYQEKWCLIILKHHTKNTTNIPWQIILHYKDSCYHDRLGYIVPKTRFLSAWQVKLVYIPNNSKTIIIQPVMSYHDLQLDYSISLHVLSRPIAALYIAIEHPFHFLKSLLKNALPIQKHLQLSLYHNQRQELPVFSYTRWISYYDQWTDLVKNNLFNSPFYSQWPSINIHTTTHSISSSLVHPSLATQWYLNTSSDTPTYIGLLQNNEILPPHSLAVFADQASRFNYPAALYADSDQLELNQKRTSPLFKPKSGIVTLLSGILTQDIWLIRKDIFEQFNQVSHPNFTSLHAYRMAIALFLWEHNFPIHHIPFILSHRTAPPNQEAKREMDIIVKNFTTQRKWNIQKETENFPFHLKFHATTDPVSIVIPTTLSSQEIQNCLLSIVQQTNYPIFEVILIISQNTPLTSLQQQMLTPLLAHNNVTTLHFPCDSFNFSKSCNAAILKAKYPFIALINDDVKPKNTDWLACMMGHMQDEQVGIVGAKLYYPNGLIQHAGIIMGAANLCEHAGRFQKETHNFFLENDHDVCAVTGACMLIRRKAYNQVNGFDPRYEIAYNDVDFCLKLHQIGYRIIQCQQAKLIHYESLSLGNHYTGKRAGKEREEIIAMRNSYTFLCNDDPFYNPNLSLQKGMDYYPAFPPRISIPFGKIQ